MDTLQHPSRGKRDVKFPLASLSKRGDLKESIDAERIEKDVLFGKYSLLLKKIHFSPYLLLCGSMFTMK